MSETKERLVQAIRTAADEALPVLAAAALKWEQVLQRKMQAHMQLQEARRLAEVAEAELIQGAIAEGRINGKNAEERARQVTLLLDAERRTAGNYSEAMRALESMQRLVSELDVTEQVARTEYEVAKIRCRVLEAQLRALAD